LLLESTLQDLPLYSFGIELSCSGMELAQVFEQHPLLPGAVLLDQGWFVGVLSRQRLLEYLIRPHGMDIFLSEPLRVLYSYSRSDILLLSGDTPIVTAAQQALRRSPDQQGEPLLVQVSPQTYHLLDIHALNIAYWQIRGIETQVRYERTQSQMIQSDKMASLGRLVDGVAHEILDPVSFIWGNLSHVTAYSNSLLELLAAYEKHLPDPPTAIAHLREDREIDYLCQDLPRTIESIRTGAERLSKLASSLQNFCHIDAVYPKPADLNELIDSIVLLLKGRLTGGIQMIRHYGHLPPVQCFAGELNQVFMNILSNAVDTLLNEAISQQSDRDFKPRRHYSQPVNPALQPAIEITTQVCTMPLANGEPSRWISVIIADNGPGLSYEACKKILESFTVRQRAAKETSLAVSYQIVTAKHGGQFIVRSRSAKAKEDGHDATTPDDQAIAIDMPLQGTEFEILLPLA